jgi:hypothetical protein
VLNHICDLAPPRWQRTNAYRWTVGFRCIARRFGRRWQPGEMLLIALVITMAFLASWLADDRR